MSEYPWVYALCVQTPVDAREGIGLSGAGVRVSCEPPNVVVKQCVQIIWEEQQLSIPAQLHLQPLID